MFSACQWSRHKRTCTHVQVVYGGKVNEILQVMGITAGMKVGFEMGQRGGEGRVPRLWQPISDQDLGQGLTTYMYCTCMTADWQKTCPRTLAGGVGEEEGLRGG